MASYRSEIYEETWEDWQKIGNKLFDSPSAFTLDYEEKTGFKQFEPRDVQINILGRELTKSIHVTAFCAHHLIPFWMIDRQLEEGSAEHLDSLLCSYIALLSALTGEQVIMSSPIAAMLEKCMGIRVKYQVVRTVSELQELTVTLKAPIRDVHCMYFKVNTLRDHNCMICLTFVIFAFLCNEDVTVISSLASTRRKSWIVAIKTFAESFNYTLNTDELQTPKLLATKSIMGLFSAHFEVRREVFQTIWAASNIENKYTNGFRSLLTLLKFSEMRHIYAINTFLYEGYEAIFAMSILRPERERLLNAWRYLRYKPAHERPYIKLLYSREDTLVLHQDRFPRSTAAAYALANFYSQESFSYYTQTGYYNTVKQAVRLYLKGLSELATMEATSARTASMPEDIRELKSIMWKPDLD